MKKFLKIFGGIIIAAALVTGGYVAGSHDGMDSISSALPRVSLKHELPPSDAPGLPSPETDDIKDALAQAGKTDEASKMGRTVVKTDESASQSGWTLIKSYDCALIGDDGASVSLYTSAQTIDNEIIWDDSQQWVVEVSDKNGGYYVLMDRLISNGSAYVEVVEADGEKSVNVFVKTSAGMEIKQYTYSGNGFAETTLYSSGAVNTLCSTVPSYQ